MTARAKKVDLRWTEGRRRDFIRVLAETYDVEAALREAELTWPQVCELRVRYPEFAVRFEEVIAAGYDRLETMLLRQAGIGRDGAADAALAQALLKQRRTPRAEAATAAARKAAGPIAARKQMIDDIMKRTAPLKAVLNGRDGANEQGNVPGEARGARSFEAGDV